MTNDILSSWPARARPLFYKISKESKDQKESATTTTTTQNLTTKEETQTIKEETTTDDVRQQQTTTQQTQQNTELQIQLCDKLAVMPSRGTGQSAGFDVSATESMTIPPRARRLVNTGIVAVPPQGTYIRIAPRSGLAANHSIDVAAGVVDADYRGQIKVVLVNHSDTAFDVKPGDRVAQLILEKIAADTVCRQVQVIGQTARGTGGFGHTGMNPNPTSTAETAQRLCADATSTAATIATDSTNHTDTSSSSTSLGDLASKDATKTAEIPKWENEEVRTKMIQKWLKGTPVRKSAGSARSYSY